MSMLKAALSREATERAHVQAVQLDRKEEREALVAAIHKVFQREVAELEKLPLKGDYSARPTVREAQLKGLGERRFGEREKKFGFAYGTEHGLELHLGSTISREELCLVVTERTDKTTISAEIRVNRYFPSKSETVATFHGHTSPNELLEKYFEKLAKYLADVKPA